MKIAFLLPCRALVGGVLTVLEHAGALRARGHDVTIFYSDEPELRNASETAFDFAMATWWETVSRIRRIRARHYGYFVQGFEERFYRADEHDRRVGVELTFREPFHLFTVSEALRRHLRRRYGRDAIVIPNGVHPRDSAPLLPPTNRLRVLIEGPHCHAFKRIPLAFAAVHDLDVETVFLTSDAGSTPAHWRIDHRFVCVPHHETPAIYRSCDVLLKLSTTEGSPLAVLDMFAAGGTAIVSRWEGHEEIVEQGFSGLVVPIDDETAVRTVLLGIMGSRKLLEHLKAGARETARRFVWKPSHDLLESRLAYICAWPGQALRPWVRAPASADTSSHIPPA